MNIKKVLAVGLLGVSLAAGTALASVEDEIRERIKPLGEVCLQGEDCGTASAAPAQASSSGPRSGQAVYDAACAACHVSGVAGAPILGDASAWAPRIDKGMEILTDHVVNGFNAMPARGACADCSDEELVAAIEYMIDESQ